MAIDLKEDIVSLITTALEIGLRNKLCILHLLFFYEASKRHVKIKSILKQARWGCL